jgi:O-acetyl-ADP-ribose deacetylase (regulator of RNase III)
MKTIKGDLIEFALRGDFDLIGHGANCFNTMGAGIAKAIKERVPEAYDIDQMTSKGDIRKLGNFTYAYHEEGDFYAINCYSQYNYGINHLDGTANPLDYEALALCLRKINHIFKGKSIGLPMIGCGLAGGDWDRVSKIIETELKDMDVTIVVFE